MQPHNPYLSIGPVHDGFQESISKALEGHEKKQKTLLGKIRGGIGKIMEKTLGWRYTSKIRKKLNLIDGIGNKDMAQIAKKYGKDGLRQAYKDNLETVLQEVQTTVDRLPDKKIVITSDHGDLLGENDMYGHAGELNHEILFEVPWLEIEK